MKSKLHTVALTGMVALSSLMSAAAFASDGTITITGAITASSCTVKSGATSAANGDVTVALDKVSTIALAKTGETAGFKGFSINLSSCPGAVVGAIKASFDAGSLNVDATSGRLKLTGTASENANNVQLELRNEDGSVIKVGDDATIKGASIVKSGTTGGATLNYKVGYYATGAATAGKANSAVTYSIIYP